MPSRTIDLIAREDGDVYTLVGGAIALDFVNLLSPRGDPRAHDWLIPARNADRWAAALDLPGPAAVLPRDLRDLRERFARVFRAVIDGSTPDDDDVAEIGQLATESLSSRALAPRAGGVDWVDTSPTLVGALAVDASRLLTAHDAPARLRSCPRCRRLFLDTTRNRSRTWCDPDACGNRERQRRHYRRAQAAPR